MSTPTRRVLPPIWLLFAMVSSYVLNRWLPIVVLVPEPWKYSGILPIVLGTVIAISSSTAFRRAGTPVVPFERSTALVTTGWYRMTRNPMYLGLALIQCGVSLLGGSLGAFLPLPLFVAIIHFRFIRGEEEFLEEIFGQQYREFRGRVRRWI